MSMQHFLSWNQEDHEGFDTEIIGSKRRPRWTSSAAPTPAAPASEATAVRDQGESVTNASSDSSPASGRTVTPKAEDVRPVQFRNHLAHTPKLSF